jgi:hypothetical protein
LCPSVKNENGSLAGQAAGIKEVNDGIRLVSFMGYHLGYNDLEEKTLLRFQSETARTRDRWGCD